MAESTDDMSWRCFIRHVTTEVLNGKPGLRLVRLCKSLWSTNPSRQAALRLRLPQLLGHQGYRSLARWQRARLAMRFGVHLAPGTVIGRGLRLPHPTSIVIGSGLRIGARCRMYQQVTLGAAPPGHGDMMCRVGDDVTIYPGAKFVGEGRVGNRVNVGTNAVVTKAFGDDVVVAGSPARVVREIRADDRTGSVR